MSVEELWKEQQEFKVADNPKEKVGMKKPDMSCVPSISQFELSMAHLDGAIKYGKFNWRESQVKTSTYIAAINRHAGLYSEGEDIADDSKVKHLAHIMACCSILLDAEVNGCLIDDRPVVGDSLAKYKKRMAEIEEWVKARTLQSIANKS